MFSMAAPSSPALEKFQNLHASSSELQDQLNDLLRGEDYQECVPNLEGDDLVWLVEYLDEVCRPIALPDSPLKLAY